MVPVVVNTKTKETIIATAGTCLMILWYYNSTLNICSSVEGWGNSGNGLAVYRMGVHGEKLALPFLVFTFQPCIVMHVNSISKCKKTYIFKINHTGLKQNSQKMHVQIVGWSERSCTPK